MNFKNLIASANARLESKFDSLGKISLNILIYGQFFLLMILLADLLYAVHISADPWVFSGILKSVQILFENAASGLFLLWITAIFIDYIDKKNSL
jgi:hypothetical protein